MNTIENRMMQVYSDHVAACAEKQAASYALRKAAEYTYRLKTAMNIKQASLGGSLQDVSILHNAANSVLRTKMAAAGMGDATQNLSRCAAIGNAAIEELRARGYDL